EGVGHQQPLVALPCQSQLRRLEAVRRRHAEGAGPGEGQGAAAGQHDRSHHSRLSDARAVSRIKGCDLCRDSIDPWPWSWRLAAWDSGIRLYQREGEGVPGGTAEIEKQTCQESCP